MSAEPAGLLSVKQAADVLGVDSSYVRRLANRGELEVAHVDAAGRRWFDRRDLEAYERDREAELTDDSL